MGIAILTFGGAFSNHLAAVASAGHQYGFQTHGIVRGEELETQTLTQRCSIVHIRAWRYIL